MLRAISQAPAGEIPIRVARRYITRAPHPGGEENIELDPTEFKHRKVAGDFLFAWQSHGNQYAIGREVLRWLEAGEDVVVNGSREYLETALQIHPGLVPIWLAVSDDVLRARLEVRGRETAAQIEQRLAHSDVQAKSRRPEYACIDNNGPIDSALAQFMTLRRDTG